MARKKITQNELRRLMGEQKKKIPATSKKIESPLAKYDDSGQLTCVVCDHVVRGEAVWAVHLNSKKHRENIAKKTKRKEAPVVEFKIPAKKSAPSIISNVKPKSILKNSYDVQKLPDNFFELHNIPSGSLNSNSDPTNESNMTMEVEEEFANGDQLPEGFFDDPKLDAKVRNVEYKDPVEEEWEHFQKEIKEETSKAQQIISEDQEEATTERQIEEIDEQMRHWSRVVNLEQKKKEAIVAVEEVKLEREDEDDNENEFEEFVDWRSKSSFL